MVARSDMKGALLLLTVVACMFKASLRFETVSDEVVVENVHRQLRGVSSNNINNNHEFTSPFRQRRKLNSDPIRFAWGIMSRPEDVDLRNSLRETYLSSDPRICVLDDSLSLPPDCQIAYAFLLPTWVVHDSSSSAFISSATESPKDIFYLPETPDRSLMSTWFRFASRLDVDYVAKADATTLLFPDKFLRMAQEMLESPGMLRVIGGNNRDRWDCGGFAKWKCRQMKGRTYLSSELFFMSKDLASMMPLDYSDEQPISLSNWLSESLPLAPILQVTVQPSHGLWESQPKDTTGDSIRERWEFLQNQQFSRKLLRPNLSPVPRWNGKSLLDEFYRRIPWKRLPETLTRFNLP